MLDRAILLNFFTPWVSEPSTRNNFPNIFSLAKMATIMNFKIFGKIKKSKNLPMATVSNGYLPKPNVL